MSNLLTKNTVPFTTVNPLKSLGRGGGGEPVSPATSTVPSAVPSLFQSLSSELFWENGENSEAK